MLSIPESVRVFVARDPVDFRRQFDGLSAIARDELGKDPLNGDLFVFFNKRRDRIKLLVWQHTGFWLFYKRLECGTFESFADAAIERGAIEIDARRLRLLLDGIDLRVARFRRHFAHPLRIGARSDGGGTTTTGHELRGRRDHARDRAVGREGRTVVYPRAADQAAREDGVRSSVVEAD